MKNFKQIMEAESADKAFNRNLTAVYTAMKRIDAEVGKMAKEQKKEKKNYGFAGSMSYVREELENILSFLKGQG